MYHCSGSCISSYFRSLQNLVYISMHGIYCSTDLFKINILSAAFDFAGKPLYTRGQSHKKSISAIRKSQSKVRSKIPLGKLVKKKESISNNHQDTA